MALQKLSTEKEDTKRSLGEDQTRVSAQELALAVAALEQRQSEAEQSLEEMLSVDESIRELGLPFSPQEIWAEIQARRSRLSAEVKSPSRAGLWLRRRKKAAGLSLAAALLASAVIYGIQTQSVADSLAKNPVQHITLADVARYEIVREPTPHGIRLCTLAEVPDNATAILNADTLVIDNSYVDQNTQNDTPKLLPITANNGEPSNWQIIKHTGRLYVRGWIPYDVSPPAALLSGITIYSTPSALGGGSRMLPLTLLATRGILGNRNLMSSRATGAGWESIHFDKVQLDKYAKEKW